jgi:hypothetical protein
MIKPLEEAISRILEESKSGYFRLNGDILTGSNVSTPVWYKTEREAKASIPSFAKHIKVVKLKIKPEPKGYEGFVPDDKRVTKTGFSWKFVDSKTKKSDKPKAKPKAKTKKTVDKMESWVNSAKKDIINMVLIGEISPSAIDILDYIDTNYRADSPKDKYDIFSDRIYKWAKIRYS